MFKASIGLSRKLSRDCNTTEYSIDLEGDIPSAAETPNAALDAIQKLFRLAEDALSQEIDRDDRAPRRPETSQGGARPQRPQFPRMLDTGNDTTDRQEPPASRNQLRFLFLLARRHELSRPELEARIEQTLGKQISVNQLGKREAGKVIDALNQQAPPPESRA